MLVVPKRHKKINAFTDVKVLTNKDIYQRVGKRLPQQPKSSDFALFSLSKVQQIALGEQFADMSLRDESAPSMKATEQAVIVEDQQPVTE